MTDGFRLMRRSPAGRLRYLEDEVIRLTAENALFAAALAAATHAYEPCGAGRSDSCDHDYAAERDGSVWLCMATRSDPVHQTPDAVRARRTAGEP